MAQVKRSSPARANHLKPGPAAARLARDAVALVVGVLVYGALAPMLVQIAAVIQIALVTGVSVGLLATVVADAAAVGVLSGVLGLLWAQPYEVAAATGVTQGLLVAATVLGSGLVAAGAALLTRRGPKQTRSWLALAGVGIVLVNLWSTTLVLDTTPLKGGPAGLTALSFVPPAGQTLSDNEFYQRVMWLMQRGQGYYHAFRQAFRENPRWGTDPTSVVGYRMPTLFWFWRLLPGKPLSLIIALLALCTIAVAAAVWLAATRVHVSLALCPAVLLTSYFLMPCTTNGLLMMEPWAACLGLASIACAATSYRHRHSVVWLAAAAGLALLATLVRETMGFLLLAGSVASLRAPSAERTRRLVVWGSALGLFALAYAAHALAIGGAVSRTGTLSSYLQGGIESLWLALTYATDFMGGPWPVLLCGALAIAGAASAPEADSRAHLLFVVLAPLAIILLTGNRALQVSGVRINYWGVILVPILVAVAPWAAVLVRGAGWTLRSASSPGQRR
jgi:hypothetical protein